MNLNLKVCTNNIGNITKPLKNVVTLINFRLDLNLNCCIISFSLGRKFTSIKQVNYFYFCIKPCWQLFALHPIIKDSDSDLISGKDNMWSGAILVYPVSTPSCFKPIVLPFNLNVGPLTVNCERSRKVVEGDQKIEILFGL